MAFKVRARHLWQIDGKRNKPHLHCFLLVYAVLVISSGAIYAPLQRLQGRPLPGVCSCHVLRMPRACLRSQHSPWVPPTHKPLQAACTWRCRCCFKTCVKPKISNQFRQLSSRTATCDSGEGRRLVEAPRASASAFLFSPLLVGSSAASAFPGSALPPSAGGGWPFGRTTLAAPPPRPAKIV